MNGLHKKVFTRVFGTHMGVLFLLLFVPWLKGCFHPKPKEIITFIDLAAMPPPPAPEIEPEPEPVPEPKPIPKPKSIPKPAVTNTPPKKVETNAPPKKAEPKPEKKKEEPKKPAAKPKTLEERLKEVRKGGKPVSKPTAKPAPALDFSGIQSALNSANTGSGSGSGSGVYSPFAGYYDSVKRQMYSVWQQPAGAPIGLSATAAIRVERDGTVSRKSIIRRSGHAPFDQSVQSALDATSRLPVPPADLPSRDIEIEFVLAD